MTAAGGRAAREAACSFEPEVGARAVGEVATDEGDEAVVEEAEGRVVLGRLTRMCGETN